MRKPTFCICENKDADQLRGNREADQRLCFRYTDSSIPLLHIYTKFQASSHLVGLYSLVCVGPGRKPERWFSHDAAQMYDELSPGKNDIWGLIPFMFGEGLTAVFFAPCTSTFSTREDRRLSIISSLNSRIGLLYLKFLVIFSVPI